MSSEVIVVTGATGRHGTGRATVEFFAAKGWNVVINYSRDRAAAVGVVARAMSLGATGAIAVRADVGSDQDCRELAATVEREMGRCDLLVNNAATTRFVRHEDLYGLLEQDFAEILRVNVTGCFQASRALYPLLKTTKGQVVNISSMGSLTGKGSCIAYAASKAAINVLTLSLARALAPDVRVNALLPGFIDGGWMQGMEEGQREGLRASHAARSPLKTVLVPRDVAEAVWWLRGGPVKQTGQLIKLDAGTHLEVA